MKVGDKVWVIKPGRYPNSRSDYWEQAIVGETSRSWIVGVYEEKHSKKNPQFYTQEQFNKVMWIKENRHRLVDKIRSIDDYEILKKIESLIGPHN